MAKSTFSTASYNDTTRVLKFLNITSGGKATLPVKGDLSNYKALVLDINNSSVTISVKFTFIGANGVSQSKVFYQNAVTSNQQFIISLTDTAILSAVNKITSIAIGAKPGGTFVQFNGVYFQDIDTGGIINSSDTLTVDTTQKFQTVTGFGGMAMNSDWSTYLSNAQVDLAFGNGNTQLGLNIMRVRIDPAGATKWAVMVAAMKRAKQYGAIILATPWSPPASLKTNGSTVGGAMKDSSFAAYAAFLKSFVVYMASKGVTVDAISVQNEPDWATTYESCVWTPSQMFNFVKNYGDSLGTKCIAAESFNYKRSFTDSILNDSIAVNKLGYVGGHIYGDGLYSYDLARQKGKQVWMTEHLIGSDSLRLPYWQEQLVFAKELNDCMLANFNAYLWWHIRRFYGMIGDGQNGSVNGVANKRGYVFSQFSKNITGLTRVKTSITDKYADDLQVSSYMKDGKLVVMVLNLSKKSFKNITFNLPLTPNSATGFTTTSTDNLLVHAVSIVAGQMVSTSIDSFSVNTFTFTFTPDVLPIAGISLRALLNHIGVNVQWNTIGEGTSKKFVVEKSLDGVYFFAIDSILNNSSQTVFNYLDYHIPESKAYYRIKVLNNDGSWGYSPVVTVNNVKSSGEYKIFPNPITGGEFNLGLNEVPRGKYQLSLYNTSGKLVFVKSIEHLGGTSNYEIDFEKNTMNAGNYKAIIRNNTEKGNIVFRSNLVLQ